MWWRTVTLFLLLCGHLSTTGVTADERDEGNESFWRKGSPTETLHEDANKPLWDALFRKVATKPPRTSLKSAEPKQNAIRRNPEADDFKGAAHYGIDSKTSASKENLVVEANRFQPYSSMNWSKKQPQAHLKEFRQRPGSQYREQKYPVSERPPIGSSNGNVRVPKPQHHISQELPQHSSKKELGRPLYVTKEDLNLSDHFKELLQKVDSSFADWWKNSEPKSQDQILIIHPPLNRNHFRPTSSKMSSAVSKPRDPPTIMVQNQMVQTQTEVEKRPSSVRTRPSAAETRPNMIKQQPEMDRNRPNTVEARPDVRPSTLNTRPNTVDTRPNTVDARPNIIQLEPGMDRKWPKTRPIAGERWPNWAETRPIVANLIESEPGMDRNRPMMVETRPSVMDKRPERDRNWSNNLEHWSSMLESESGMDQIRPGMDHWRPEVDHKQKYADKFSVRREPKVSRNGTAMEQSILASIINNQNYQRDEIFPTFNLENSRSKLNALLQQYDSHYHLQNPPPEELFEPLTPEEPRTTTSNYELLGSPMDLVLDSIRPKHPQLLYPDPNLPYGKQRRPQHNYHFSVHSENNQQTFEGFQEYPPADEEDDYVNPRPQQIRQFPLHYQPKDHRPHQESQLQKRPSQRGRPQSFQAQHTQRQTLGHFPQEHRRPPFPQPQHQRPHHFHSRLPQAYPQDQHPLHNQFQRPAPSQQPSDFTAILKPPNPPSPHHQEGQQQFSQHVPLHELIAQHTPPASQQKVTTWEEKLAQYQQELLAQTQVPPEQSSAQFQVQFQPEQHQELATVHSQHQFQAGQHQEPATVHSQHQFQAGQHQEPSTVHSQHQFQTGQHQPPGFPQFHQQFRPKPVHPEHPFQHRFPAQQPGPAFPQHQHQHVHRPLPPVQDAAHHYPDQGIPIFNFHSQTSNHNQKDDYGNPVYPSLEDEINQSPPVVLDLPRSDNDVKKVE